MQTLDEETLVLFYYGELNDAEMDAVRARLATDAELATRFTHLSAELNAVPEPEVPERDELYGRRVWARVDAALDEREIASKREFFPRWPVFKFAGGLLAVSLVAVIAFQLGRHAPPTETMITNTVSAPADDYQARLLNASLVNHFGDAERLLTEIANSDSAEVDIEAEKEWAIVLLVANRLYRFAAEQAGQHRIVQLLGDMEPVLIELANGAGQLTPEEYRVLRQSISERDLLFKVRSTNYALKPQSAQL